MVSHVVARVFPQYVGHTLYSINQSLCNDRITTEMFHKPFLLPKKNLYKESQTEGTSHIRLNLSQRKKYFS